MSLAPEVRDFLDWDRRLADRLTGLALPEQRVSIGDALAEHARETNLVVAEVAAVADLRVPVAGGEIALRV